MMVKRIHSIENLMDSFTKTLIGSVFVGHRNNMGFK